MHKKFKYVSDGMNMTAGGILPYDDTGVWLLEEKTRSGTEWSDPGGKYRYEDCDIYVTISREFMEELFYSVSLSRENVITIDKTHNPIYVSGHDRKPVYQCYVVHTDELKKYGVDINIDAFMAYKKRAIRKNPYVRVDYYPLDLRKISYEELYDALKNKKDSINLSFRVKKIITTSHLFSKIKNKCGGVNRLTNKIKTLEIS